MLSRAHNASVWTSGIVLLAALGVLLARAQQTPQPPASSTRPPDNNERGLRPLTPEEIAPNLNFYAMDPLYVPGPLPVGVRPSSRAAAGRCRNGRPSRRVAYHI